MTRFSYLTAVALVVALATGWYSPAVADTSMALTVSRAGEDPVVLTLEQLDAMPQTSFTTSTIWTNGKVTFSGVPLHAVLGTAADEGNAVEMIALNDYKVVMPLSSVEDAVPLIATRMNGETMSVRDKGPYWVVFPYDDDTRFQTETAYSYSIWQLNRLEVVD